MLSAFRGIKRKDACKGSIFASTYFIYSLIFWGYPFVWLLILTFTKWQYVGHPKFNGFHNIMVVLHDEIFWKSIWNIFRFMFYYIPMTFFFSMLFAIGLSRLKFGKTFVVLCFLLANVSSGVAYSLVFQKLFAENGPLNQFLFQYFHITIQWFTSPTLAMFSIALVVVWKFVGYYGIILYSGLIGIPKSIYEAAELDGAGKLRTFFSITVPLLNPQIIMIMVLAISLSFGIFTEAYMITGGGPLETTTTPMLLMYEAAFKKLNPTYAATMIIFVSFISFALIKISRRMFEKDVQVV